jgi:hypothetical protein
MKESILKNQKLKSMAIYGIKSSSIPKKIELYDLAFKNEYHFVYKLLNLTRNSFNLSFSKNIYFNSKSIDLKLNYLKCRIGLYDFCFLNFDFFDFIFLYYQQNF